MPNEERHRYVLSLLAVDRPGILSKLAGALTDLGANIDGISQTVIAHHFTVILTASFPHPVAHEAILAAVRRELPPAEASVIVRDHAPPLPMDAARGPRYMLTLTGEDRTGILKAVTGLLAGRGINIEDWYVQFDGTRVTHFGEVRMPPGQDVAALQRDLEAAAAALGLRSSLQHENLFRVTSEVARIPPWELGEPDRA